ncbi:MAG: T9SS C-terminal target domain-containing protein [Bacteroidetes bacterium]|nr:MAG: T9SS C-terminal target domain-containing protein [Bacteroidota bacterium]
MNKFFGLVAILAIFIAWQYPGNNDQWKNKIAPSLLLKLENGSAEEFIVVLTDQVNLNQSRLIHNKTQKGTYVYQKLRKHAEASQKGILNLLQERGSAYKSFFIVNAVYSKGDLELVRSLALRSDVRAIEDNPQVQIERTSTGGDSGNMREGIEWGIEKIGADQVWEMGYNGQGVIVAGADTGVEWDHPAIMESYQGWDADGVDHNYSWYDAVHEISPLHNDTIISPTNNPCGLSSTVPCDDHNHGTHTVGTMTGDDGMGNQIGVAPGAKWIACRNMERGWGSPATYIECFEWFLAPTDVNGENADTSKAPHVINNSWGCPPVEGCNPDNFSAMETTISNIKSAGVVVVVSAGNSGSSCGSISNPAAIFEPSFTIGAFRSNDTIANFSSRGLVSVDESFRMKPNVAAPGVGVRSCVRGGGYSTWNGTSMAGPHVAGMVALMISANPALAGEVDIIEDIIEATAIPMVAEQDCNDIAGDAVPNPVYGYGRIDALAAVEQALLYTTIEDPAAPNSLTVFPNPFSDQIELNMNNLTEKVVLSIFSADGKLMIIRSYEPQAFVNDQIDTGSLPKGMYFYQLSGKNVLESGKLVRVD